MKLLGSPEGKRMLWQVTIAISVEINPLINSLGRLHKNRKISPAAAIRGQFDTGCRSALLCANLKVQ